MLYAKKTPRDGSPAKGLAEHSLDVLQAADSMFRDRNEPSTLALRWLRFFRLEQEQWPLFWANLAACCLLHDIGKADDGFQRAMTAGGHQQILRHEHLSALILSLQSFMDWLGANPLLRPELVVSAVACHHLKASRRPPKKAKYPEFAVSYSDDTLIQILEPDAVDDYLRAVAHLLSLPEPPEVPIIWSFDNSAGQPVGQARSAIQRLFHDLPRTRTDLLLPALKAALIAADAAGSGLPRESHDIDSWLKHCLHLPPLTSADIGEGVLAPRISEIETRKRRQDPGYTFAYQDFQTSACKLPERALLLAGCGAGKTLAAWKWIGAQLRDRPSGRALFLYPTRATATEGFKDYVSHAPEAMAATLLHGTASYELAGMFDNPDDPRGERSYETDARLFAVGVWEKRLFSATLDQFFGFMQQVYRSACLLPVLVDGVVVIDEVHSLDPGLFSTMERFLECFDVPVLCMTASLPAQRRERLKRLGLQVYPGESDAFRDLQAQADAPRYQVHRLAGKSEAQRIAEEALDQGKRVLWVVNTVDRCQVLAEALSELKPICYHSRFKLKHRNDRHREVIRRFADDRSGALLAITTQVCEMSLDLDADVLISEHAPISALIQRMGRCNRHPKAGRDLGDVYLYPPDATDKPELPYTIAELSSAERFIAELIGDTCSQSRLEELLEQYSRLDPREKKRLTAFLDDGAWARGGEEALREGIDVTVPAVLDSDLESGHWHPGADGLVVPVPRRLAESDARLPRHLRRAPSSHYDPQLGFRLEPTCDATGVQP